MKKLFSYAATLLCLSLLYANVAAAATAEYKIVIKNHQFNPSDLAIPANQKIKLIVENQDSAVEEFDSPDLNREKIVKGNNTAIIFIGPLKPGIYRYSGEFHAKTAQGTITAK